MGMNFQIIQRTCGEIEQQGIWHLKSRQQRQGTILDGSQVQRNGYELPAIYNNNEFRTHIHIYIITFIYISMCHYLSVYVYNI